MKRTLRFLLGSPGNRGKILDHSTVAPVPAESGPAPVKRVSQQMAASKSSSQEASGTRKGHASGTSRSLSPAFRCQKEDPLQVGIAVEQESSSAGKSSRVHREKSLSDSPALDPLAWSQLMREKKSICVTKPPVEVAEISEACATANVPAKRPARRPAHPVQFAATRGSQHQDEGR